MSAREFRRVVAADQKHEAPLDLIKRDFGIPESRLFIEHYMGAKLTLDPRTPPNGCHEPEFPAARPQDVFVDDMAFSALRIDGESASRPSERSPHSTSSAPCLRR